MVRTYSLSYRPSNPKANPWIRKFSSSRLRYITETVNDGQWISFNELEKVGVERVNPLPLLLFRKCHDYTLKSFSVQLVNRVRPFSFGDLPSVRIVTIIDYFIGTQKESSCGSRLFDRPTDFCPCYVFVLCPHLPPCLLHRGLERSSGYWSCRSFPGIRHVCMSRNLRRWSFTVPVLQLRTLWRRVVITVINETMILTTGPLEVLRLRYQPVLKYDT